MTDLITERSVRFIEQQCRSAVLPRSRLQRARTGRTRSPIIRRRRSTTARHVLPYDEKTGTRADYVEMLERADQGVGQILAALDGTASRRNTLVIFTNDNGGEWLSRNAPLFNRKFTV